MPHKQNKLQIFKSLAHYGVHIWAILIIANAALAYAFHFSTQAANTDAQISQDAPVPEQDTNVPEVKEVKKNKPGGALITFAFTIPGVGSGSANMTPVRLQRNVTLFLYAPDANSLNKAVKPLYTFQTTADNDTNTQSPTYTSYVVQDYDFGTTVKEGKYQIAFRTDESLRTLIKESQDNVGGQLFELKKTTKLRKIPLQKVLMGDTLPKEGDNVVDISDYNAFVNCFGERSTTDFCTGNNYGDFDDNGAIDGVDYNLLLRSFGELLKQGQSIPRITVAPTNPARVSKLSNTATPAEPKKPSPTKAAEKEQTNSGGSVLGGIFFFLFLLVGGGVAFFLFKKNEKFRTIIKAILHQSPTGTPPPPVDPNAPATGEEKPTVENAVTTEPTAAEAPPTEAAADPNAIAASTELPVGQPQETPAVDPATVAASTEIPVTPTPQTPPPANGETVEKDYYVKKKLPGDATGIWLTLTDDNGAVEAHYKDPEVQEGFAKVTGVMKTENGKTFLEISELKAEG